MPIPGARYRVKQTSKGPVRLAFKGNNVVETKNMKTGKMHTQEEMAEDRMGMPKPGMMPKEKARGPKRRFRKKFANPAAVDEYANRKNHRVMV